MIKIIFAFAFMLLATATIFAQIPSIIEKDVRHALLVDGKPFLILGGQAHNSSGWPAMLPHVWQSAQYMHLNTLEVTDQQNFYFLQYRNTRISTPCKINEVKIIPEETRNEV